MNSKIGISSSLIPSSILSLYDSLHIIAQQEVSSFSSIFTLNLVYLCSDFLETWSRFDIVATIRFLEVLHVTIAFVISLRTTLILVFLHFPNANSALVTFSVTFSHAFLFLTSLKPNNFVAHFNFLFFINPCRILACVLTDCCSNYNLIMLLTWSLILQLGVGFPNSSWVASSNPLKQLATIPMSLKLPITLEKSEGALSCDDWPGSSIKSIQTQNKYKLLE